MQVKSTLFATLNGLALSTAFAGKYGTTEARKQLGPAIAQEPIYAPQGGT